MTGVNDTHLGIVATGSAAGLFLLLFVLAWFRARRLAQEVEAARQEAKKAFDDARTALSSAQALVDQQLFEAKAENERVRRHYESETLKAQATADAVLAETMKELQSLRRYGNVVGGANETAEMLANAIKEATAVRIEAQALQEQARNAAAEERTQATRRASEIRAHADALLDQATRDAARMIDEAHENAKRIGGDAYLALRDKEKLERAVVAIRNVIDGYGDRYVIPTHSIIDDLAADFGHTEAGRALTAARAQSRRMVEEGHAATCSYVEAIRRTTAIRFVIDAFNGRVDAILTRTKHDNHGTLAQEIRDAFALVNMNGRAFRDASILPTYLDSRLAELKWAVMVQELRLREREEQRRIKEQMREEEKARRDYERAIQESEREEALIKRALEKARVEADQATAEQRAKLEQEIALLTDRLMEAEAKNQRALSMAQQTRKGNVYVVSNIGSFGEDVFKIGMTRRLEPLDRIKELSDASVPFDFDIHAMIPCEDAPALERLLQGEFGDLRLNKVNGRKEFFRVPLNRIREIVSTQGLGASFTMLADAHEYRETQALNKMTREERHRYHLRDDSTDDASGG